MKNEIKKVNLGTLLTSLLFGMVMALFAYKYLDFPLSYSDFIAGSITWGGEGKSKEVSLVFVFISTVVLSLWVLSKQLTLFQKHDTTLVKTFSLTLLYTSIPFVMWIGEQILTKRIPSYDIPCFNAWLLMGGLIATMIWMKSTSSMPKQKVENSSFIILSFVLFTFITLSPNVLSVILLKFGESERLKNAWLIISTLWLIVLYFDRNKTRYYKYSAFISQIMLIGYFTLLLPSPYRNEGNISFFNTNALLYIIVASLIVYSIYDVYKRFRQHKDKDLSCSILSPYPIAAILILVFLSATSMPNVSPDDYHYGEKLLPFYLISKYHIIPFTDYALAHGFIDMFPAIGSSLFLDGTAATLYEGNRIITALIVIASFVTLTRFVGLLSAFILSLLLASIGIWYFAAVILSLIILNSNIKIMGYIFFLVGLTAFLLAPGQGAVFIIAMLPLVLYRSWKNKTIILNLKQVAILFIVLGVLSLFMPWIFSMIVAAVRYVLENGPINFQAYGIAWHHSWNSSRTINSSLFLYELIRTSWIFVPIFIFIFWLLDYYKVKREALFYGLFAVIFVSLMYKYSLGRIDPFGLTRLGVVSKVSIPLLFLASYVLYFSKDKMAYLSLFFVFWMGLLTPNYLHSPILNAQRSIINLGTLTDGKKIGIPKLGQGRTNAIHLGRVLEIKKIADQFLDTNETFVDVTNRGGLYFYLDRRMPIEAVPYNQPHPHMQQRSVDRLSKNPPHMALLKADNINHDGRSVSIRTHRLYRWVMQNYIPVSFGKIIIGVHKTKIERFKERFPEVALSKTYEQNMELWDTIFLLKNLQKLPVSWGKSYKSLNKKIAELKNITFTQVSFNDIAISKPNSFMVEGKDPFVVYDISKENISGDKAGILSFDFQCDRKNTNPRLQIFWSADDYGITEATSVKFNVYNGGIIVPMDAAPRWLSAKHIKNIRIDLDNANACKIFSIKNLSLGQRILDDK